jgi:hypothetical protein
LSPERLAEIRDLLKYESSIAFYSQRAKESMLLLVAEAEEAARLRAERHSTNEALDDAVKAIGEKDQRIAALEEAPLAWADQLDAKSLDNLLISLSQAADHEPMSGALDQVHEVLRGFRTAAVDLGEVARCGACKNPFDPADTSFDGRAQQGSTGFCRRCVDRCHESLDAFHVCGVCRAAQKGANA